MNASSQLGKYQPYPEYKDSGIEWIELIPKHWINSRLGFETSVKARLGWKGLKADEYVPEGYIFLATPNIKDNNIDFENVNYITQERYDESPEIKLKVGDVLVTKDGSTTGTTNIVRHLPSGATVNSSIAVIRPIKNVTSEFLFYFFTSHYTQNVIKQKQGGMGVPHLFQADLRWFHLLLPSADEQRTIAAFLDYETARIDQLIVKQQQLIELLKEKRQAVISHAVTKGLNPNAPMKDSGVEWLGQVPEHWIVIYIKHLSQVKRGASPRPIDDPKYFDEDGEYAWTRIADVSNSGMYLTSTTQRLSALGSSLSVRLNASELSIAGTVGKPCITMFKSCIHDGFVYFPSLKINNKFLYYIFDAGQAYLGLGKMGTQLNLNTETVGGIKIGLPPVDEIEEIIGYIEQQKEKYEKLITKASDTIEILKERRTALISAAITGKIDLRGWQPPKSEVAA